MTDMKRKKYIYLYYKTIMGRDVVFFISDGFLDNMEVICGICAIS